MIGILLSFPGASYIAGMDALHKQNIGTVATVLAVLAFNMIMLVLLETSAARVRDQSRNRPRPAWNGSTSWLSRRGGRVALIAATAIGIFLVTRGAIRLLS